MRIGSALVAFVFLRAAVAAVLAPSLNGGSPKDIAEHPSQPSPSLTGPKPSDAPPIFPLSGGPEPSAPPPGAPKYPTPSGESHTPPPAACRAEPTDIPLPLPASHPPLPPMKGDPSGKPQGNASPRMSGYPKAGPNMKA